MNKDFEVFDTYGHRVVKGQTVISFRGDEYIFQGCYHPRKITVKAKGFENEIYSMEFYPTVFNFTIREPKQKLTIADTEAIKQLDVILNGDQPTTCPKCGARTDFEYFRKRSSRALNTCLNCGHQFITVNR